MKKVKSITMYSTSWCGDCFRTRSYFAENNIVYSEVDIEESIESAQFVEKINNGNRSVPTIIFTFEDDSQKILVEPNIEELDLLLKGSK